MPLHNWLNKLWTRYFHPRAGQRVKGKGELKITKFCLQGIYEQSAYAIDMKPSARFTYMGFKKI